MRDWQRVTMDDGSLCPPVWNGKWHRKAGREEATWARCLTLAITWMAGFRSGVERVLYAQRTELLSLWGPGRQCSERQERSSPCTQPPGSSRIWPVLLILFCLPLFPKDYGWMLCAQRTSGKCSRWKSLLTSLKIISRNFSFTASTFSSCLLTP